MSHQSKNQENGQGPKDETPAHISTNMKLTQIFIFLRIINSDDSINKHNPLTYIALLLTSIIVFVYEGAVGVKKFILEEWNNN